MNRRSLIAAGAAGLAGVAVARPARASLIARADIQSQIDAAFGRGGGLVSLPAGSYDIDAPLVLKSGVTLGGAGMGLTTLRLVNAAGAQIRSSRVIESRWANESGPAGSPAGTDWDENIGVRDLTIDGNRGAQVSPLPTLELMNGDNTAAIVFDHYHYGTIQNVEVKAARYRGIMMMNSTTGNPHYPRVLDCQIRNTGYSGLVLLWSWNGLVRGNLAAVCGRAGIYLEGARYTIVEGNTVEASKDSGSGDGYGFVFDYNGIDSFYQAVANLANLCASHGFLVTSDGGYGGIGLLQGNMAAGNYGAGFRTYNAPNATLQGNLAKNNVRDYMIGG